MAKSEYKNRKYTVEPYNPDWGKQFETEVKNLRPIFSGEVISIEHIGSTSVPGLAGKPTIDILITVKNIKIADELSEKIESIGYEFLGDYLKQGSRLFVKEEDNIRLVNLHIFEVKHSHVREMLNLRNYFRSHPEKVEEYSKLKFDLVRKYPNDYSLYRKHKDEWMAKLKDKIIMQIPDKIISRIRTLKTPTIIGVSGFGGAGKSSFAKTLGEAIGAPVVGVDSFQKDGAFDTEYSLWEIMDFARLENEVLKPFTKNEQVSYGHFNVPTASISETCKIENSGRLIVEGVGLFRPELLKYFAYKIWVDCPVSEAIARGKKRDREEYGSPADEQWDGIWKKNDNEYFETYKPKEVADVVFTNC